MRNADVAVVDGAVADGLIPCTPIDLDNRVDVRKVPEAVHLDLVVLHELLEDPISLANNEFKRHVVVGQQDLVDNAELVVVAQLVDDVARFDLARLEDIDGLVVVSAHAVVLLVARDVAELVDIR